MKPRLFLSAPFLSALLILLLNDHVLKAVYGNALTGKLSDFAGILLVSLWLFAWQPKRIHISAWLIALAFTVWKSALATPFIALLKQWTPYAIGRVIDATNLWALTMIPLAMYFTHQKPRALLPAMFKVPVVMMAALAIMATSHPPPHVQTLPSPPLHSRTTQPATE